ncbi:MAG: tRNA epoxyqueuosine(34) reductase QueG [Ruminococcaceae bacterium]|nr:tRNA epoxyqueuosine(34) reductase QueG [Oscillospiraceae bacterium]
MLQAKEIKEYAKKLSIPAVGVCGAKYDEQLLVHLENRRQFFSACTFEEENLEKRIEPGNLMPEAESILVCLFPYYISEVLTENISRYAAVQDYHLVAEKYLRKIAEFIKSKEPDAKCLAVCDTSPLVDRQLAYRAGLGFYGKNNLLIHPVYGSYCFIGALLLNFPLEADEPMKRECAGCDACIRSCPGGALADHFGFDCERCISYLTQKKTLTEEQQKLLEGQESVYGCDACQAICPHNQNLPDTPIKEFYVEPIRRLKEEDIAAMSNRKFKETYRKYPFSWCSKQTILKNFRQTKEEKQ